MPGFALATHSFNLSAPSSRSTTTTAQLQNFDFGSTEFAPSSSRSMTTATQLQTFNIGNTAAEFRPEASTFESMTTAVQPQSVNLGNTAAEFRPEAPTTSAGTGEDEISSLKPAVLTARTGRNWASRRRPFLQQKPEQSAKCASVRASEKITELSVAKLELTKLLIESEKEKMSRAAEEHRIRIEIMRAEHQLKLEEHELKMEMMKMQLHSTQNREQ